MNLLLDTHAFLWFMEGSERISKRAREGIEAAGGVRVERRKRVGDGDQGQPR
jgi:PIN domain nuclease of toxin-antitoxin system